MTMEGTIKTITFRNEENGYTVLRVELSCSDLVTITGHLPSLQPGENVRMQGDWANHPKFGKQFACTSLEVIVPSSGKALEAYLCSGLFKGVGAVTARRLVEKFGEKTLSVLDSQPKRIREIKGFVGKRLENFVRSWQEMRGAREALLYLYGHQITGSIALRLWKKFGDTTIPVLQSNPYILTHEVWGIGFTRADEIARKLGLPMDSSFRLRAGLQYALEKAGRDGHMFLPRAALLEEARLLLSHPDMENEFEVWENLLLGLQNLLHKGELVAVQDCIYMPSLHQAEVGFARWVKSALLRKQGSRGIAKELENALDRAQKEMGITYTTEQRTGISIASHSPLFLLTGGPGTGKTTALLGILRVLEQCKISVTLAAPTGRAARRMSEMCGQEALTLHRLLEINPATGQFERNEYNPLDSGCVVVDEFSMVDARMAFSLVKALSPTTQLLCIGDPDQLPSVGPGIVLRELLNCPNIPSLRLTHIHRQAGGSDIPLHAHAILHGRIPDLNNSTHVHLIRFNSAEEATAKLLQLGSRDIPQHLNLDPLVDIQVLTPMRKGALGTHELNAALRKTLNCGECDVLFHGQTWRLYDRVMQLRNDYEKGVFNGDIGRVINLDAAESILEVEFDGRVVRYGPEDLDQLTPAYACTIHKSQGSEYPAVVIILDNSHFVMLQRNLLYTALTRARKGVWILAAPGTLERAVRNDRPVRRYTKLSQFLNNGKEFMEWMAQETDADY